MEKRDLPHNIKKTISDFVDNLKDVYGSNLISVMLYGSAASGEYSGKHSNVNVAIILPDASLSSIAKTLPFINKRKFLMINPMFFTEDYIKRSTDVFPIEFMDLKENHIILYGKDVLEDIEIDIKNMRFQCEQEIKSKIINIKRLYLRTANMNILKNILFKSITSSIHILRNLIRLKGKTPPYAKGEVLDKVAQEFQIDIASLQKILDAKKNNLKLKPPEIKNLFSSFMETLEAVSDKIDHI